MSRKAFLESIKVDDSVKRNLDEVSRNHKISKGNHTAQGGRERGDDGPGSLGRTSEYKGGGNNMGSFKEDHKKAIEKSKENGNEKLKKGEKRVQELQTVKNLLDSIDIEGEQDRQAVESLNDTYLEAGKAAHREEVEKPIESAKNELEENKSEITAEKRNVENAGQSVGEMQNATDLARDSARRVEETLKRSVDEYKGMEQQTDQIEKYLSSESGELLNQIDSIFKK